MSKILDILMDYTSGKKDVETTNAALKEAGASFYLDPGKNVLTEEEIRASIVGHYPDMANGFGLLDSGTGTLDKVAIKNGELVDCDMGIQKALVVIADRWYYVDGKKLVSEEPDYPTSGTVLPKKLDMSRRKDLAGQVVEQVTAQGTFDVYYNENGYATKATNKG